MNKPGTELVHREVLDAEIVDDATTPVVAADRTPAPIALSESAQRRRRKANADNTIRAYERHVAHYEQWCVQHGHPAYRADGDGTVLAEWVNSLADAGTGKATINQAIAAVRTAHAKRDLPKPRIEQAHEVRDGYLREAPAKRTRRALPLTVRALRSMVDTTDPNTVQGIRDRLLLALGFGMFSRRIELADLRIDDVAESPEGLVAYIARSKTDQRGDGAEVKIVPGSHPATDPVRLLRAWLAILAERGITDGPLLRSVNRWGHIGDGLTGEGVNRIVKRLAAAADLPNAEGYSGHSLRAGAATEAHRAGAPLQAIADQGRWKSDVVTRYVRAVDEWRDHPLRNVGL